MYIKEIKSVILVFIFLLCYNEQVFSQKNIRKTIPLNTNWFTVANDSNINAYNGFENAEFSISSWETVNVPHNWDKYEGYRRLLHGNRHGYAWYRKTFTVNENTKDKRYFLFFEGVGSYATVWLNGKKVGYHAGGRTSFTLDVTGFVLLNNKENILAVRADHPAHINDLPWVCGGCSTEPGFSEGSQPFGIFRPVSLIITNVVKIEPFGIHIWNDTSVNEKSAALNITAEIKNYSSSGKSIKLVHKLLNKDKIVVAEWQDSRIINKNDTVFIKTLNMEVLNPVLWSIENPYLYTLESSVYENEILVDRVYTDYGIRYISWPIYRNNGDKRFFLNGKPVFINGTAEYEHNLGQSHAFTDQQVITHVVQMKEAGFNSFRDGHQPHNLLFQYYWDSLGILFWPQMAAHIWYDSEDFKDNFKQLLRDWIKERRNCPSVILWGLENESTLPTEFAEECVQIIREMDPTSPSQRLVTTCNGGTGTDWNVIQNWSGTYAGDLFAYNQDIKRELLNGEYGAWRSLDLHTEGPFNRNGIYSENRMCQLMETKIRLAESVKDSCCGQYQWIFNSHDNPGRTQNGEGLREIDRVGPVNYKGLFSPWGEPLDVYYMYRANYVPAAAEPMVYIVSHTWPNRWTKPGIKDSIVVYSNCDKVELFNGFNSYSLGLKEKKEKGTHFQWDNIDIKYNILTAVGYVNDKVVATDRIVLFNLPSAPDFDQFGTNNNMIVPVAGYNYLYRVNCGGAGYKDAYGNIWLADQHQANDSIWGSRSWTDDFNNLPFFYASQRRTFDPIYNNREWKLLQSFRYGRDKLIYNFPVPNGEYLVELYFIEPWYGTGGSLNCEGWRVFDVAINNRVYIDDLDIWKETGHDRLLKKEIITKVDNGLITISFPEIKSGQAVISAIAISAKEKSIKQVNSGNSVINDLKVDKRQNPLFWSVEKWMDIGDMKYVNSGSIFNRLPSNFYGAEWIKTPEKIDNTGTEVANFTLTRESDVFIALDQQIKSLPEWMEGFIDQHQQMITTEKGQSVYNVYGKRFSAGSKIELGNIPNDNLMYTLVVCPVTDLGYASDQRPQTRYEAEDQVIQQDGFIIREFMERKYVEFIKPDQSLNFNFTVGLGDTYELKFRYINNTEDSIAMKIIITDMNQNIIRDDILYFSPRKDRWRTLNTNTGTSINAGTYRLQLISIDKKGLGINALDVQ